VADAITRGRPCHSISGTAGSFIVVILADTIYGLLLFTTLAFGIGIGGQSVLEQPLP